jgi:TM2 domain-containing membrane protein YozV
MAAFFVLAGSSTYSSYWWLFYAIGLLPLSCVVALTSMSVPFCVFQGLNQFQYLNNSFLSDYLPPAHCVNPDNRVFMPNGPCETLALLTCEKNYVLSSTYTNQLVTLVFLFLAVTMMICVLFLLLSAGLLRFFKKRLDCCANGLYRAKRSGCFYAILDFLTLQGPANLPVVDSFQFPAIMLVGIFVTFVLLIVFACSGVLAISNFFLFVLPTVGRVFPDNKGTILLVCDIVIYVLIGTATIALLVLVAHCFKMLRAFRTALEILVAGDQFGLDAERLTKMQRAEYTRLMFCFESVDWSAFGPHDFLRLFPISFFIAFLVLWIGIFLVCCVLSVYIVPLILNPRNPQFWEPSVTAFLTALVAVVMTLINYLFNCLLRRCYVKPKLIGSNFHDRFLKLGASNLMVSQASSDNAPSRTPHVELHRLSSDSEILESLPSSHSVPLLEKEVIWLPFRSPRHFIFWDFYQLFASILNMPASFYSRMGEYVLHLFVVLLHPQHSLKPTPNDMDDALHAGYIHLVYRSYLLCRNQSRVNTQSTS